MTDAQTYQRGKSVLLLIIYVLLVFGISNFLFWSQGTNDIKNPLTIDLDIYNDQGLTSTWEILVNHVKQQPFNLVSLTIFLFAIIHTFLCHHFSVLSKIWRDYNIRENITPVDSFGVEILRFMGEVEVVFGVWVIPLFVSIAYYYDWKSAVNYLDKLKYLEPMFVVVIMALASTKPIVKLAEDLLNFFAKLFGGTCKSWWWVILTVGPISGSLITEPGAMTISALLLSKHFYRYKPTTKFAYGTLGLLFTNISVGGVLTNFAAPPVLMVSKAWGWSTPFMLTNFGWKAVIGIAISTIAYYLVFQDEFVHLENKKRQLHESESDSDKGARIPFWIGMVHVSFLAWMVVHNHYSALFIGAFLLFLGFYQATITYQDPLNLKPPILVGFFLAGLVIHGNLQGWWIAPLLSGVSQELLLVLSGVLTSFNDNAEITFLATLIPSFDDTMKYAIVAGAVSGGGLTVIANAPNPLGQSVLSKHFFQGISAIQLLMGAVFPATVMGACFYFF